MSDNELQRRRDNWLRELDYLEAATDAGAAWLPICRADDPASGAVVAELARRDIQQCLAHGFVCAVTGHSTNIIYQRDAEASE